MILKLNTIGKEIESISQTFGAYMAECAAVCFDSQGHKSGVQCPILMVKSPNIVWLSGQCLNHRI